MTVFVKDGVEYGRGKAQVREPGARRVVSNTSGASLTKQSFAAECDIQNIVKRAFSGGIIPQTLKKPIYADVSALPDYQTALNQVIATDAAFMQLDAKARQFFENDPQNMLSFLMDAANTEKAVELGLIAAPVAAPAEPLAEPAKAGEAAP